MDNILKNPKTIHNKDVANPNINTIALVKSITDKQDLFRDRTNIYADTEEACLDHIQKPITKSIVSNCNFRTSI